MKRFCDYILSLIAAVLLSVPIALAQTENPSPKDQPKATSRSSDSQQHTLFDKPTVADMESSKGLQITSHPESQSPDRQKQTAYTLSEVDEPPRIIEKTDPIYPFEARQRDVQGSVTLRFIVTKEGDVSEPTVVKGVPPGVFDDSALKAIMRWRFEPAIKDGGPVDVIIIAPLKYELRQSGHTLIEKTEDGLQTVYTLSEIDEPPRVMKKIDPIYPYSAKRRRIQGEVTLRFIVTKEGEVVKPAVVKGEPPGVFDESALRAIVKWQFKPAIKDGEAVDVLIIAPFRFDLIDTETIEDNSKARRAYSQGRSLFSKGEYHQALDSFNRFIELIPGNLQGHFSRGMVYRNLKRYEEAIDDFDSVIMLDQDNPDVYLNRGLAYIGMEEFEKAIIDFNKVIRAKPKGTKGYIARAIALFRMKDINKGCTDLKRACGLGECRRLNLSKEEGVCKER